MEHPPVERIRATVVVAGTGAAGLCAADRLSMLGVSDILVITDKTLAGTSRNAGSDKQTYYKLTLAGAGADSVWDMAETLWSGGAMDGDIALVEAAWSARAFSHLVDAGVPFPCNDYGEYIGYKTDHDPRQRATSVGPYTSKSMVEHLQARVEAAGVPIREGLRIVDLIVEDARLTGVLAWDIEQRHLVVISCDALVYATGGPAGMYADSVYPHGQWGAQGAALRAGATAKNLTEWQFGLASIRPRWNVSGSYMQVIPHFVSTDAEGGDEREFLADAIADPAELASLVFLKGYQWPFDARKARDGSSVIDLLVYRETVMRGRRVFLDFRTNSRGFVMESISVEAREYLSAAGAVHMPTPIERLRAMNEPAYRFYLERGPVIDLATDLLEIAVCAQHNNGGLAGDAWWESNIVGLYPVGEAAGAHGVYRPGGSALNSGQVGAMRAATRIAAVVRGKRGARGCEPCPAVSEQDLEHDNDEPPSDKEKQRVGSALALLDQSAARFAVLKKDEVGEALTRAARRMSDRASLVRTPDGIAAALDEVRAQLASLEASPPAGDPASRRSMDRLFLLRDILTSQFVYLSAMSDYLDHGGRSRGSVLYTDPVGDAPRLPSGQPLDLPEDFRFSTDDGALDSIIQEVTLTTEARPVFTWRDRHPIPREDEPFELVWKKHRNQN